MGGIIAKQMGLPVEQFVVAVNENDEFVKLLDTDIYEKIAPSKNCLSSAMNVGHPSNLTRLIDLYGGHMDEKGHLHRAPDMEKMREDFWGISISNDQTKETIGRVFKQYDYILEPHGSVAWSGLEAYLKDKPTDSPCVSFETADPAKFPDEIKELIGIDPELPKNMAAQTDKEEFINDLDNTYIAFRSFLKNKYSKA